MADTHTDNQLASLTTNVRHFLWNDDYIELLAHKFDLQKVRTLVDIGSGLGYLSGLFALYMRAGANVYGFDLDAECVREAQQRADANPYSVNFHFAVQDAHALPLADGAADLTMCQHVLMHMAEPQAILAEMLRVTRPGGRVVAFEPNTLVQSLVLDSVSKGYTLEQRLAVVRYQSYYETGKQRLGDGNDSIGDALPGLFRSLGLEEIEVRLSDKAGALVPPYDTEEKRARVQELLSWRESYERNRGYIRECFLRGGGSEEEFAAFDAFELAEHERVRRALADETFVHPGGLMTYIVIGTKPGKPGAPSANGSQGAAFNQYEA